MQFLIPKQPSNEVAEDIFCKEIFRYAKQCSLTTFNEAKIVSLYFDMKS